MSTKNKKTVKSPAQKMALVKADGFTKNIVEAGTGMFTESGEGFGEDMEIKSRAPWIKPLNFPVGKLLTGVLKGIGTRQSNQPDGRPWCMLEIVPLSGGIGVAITATATITEALQITYKNGVYETPFLGHKVSIEKLADKIPSKKGNDAWHFLVAVSRNPVSL